MLALVDWVEVLLQTMGDCSNFEGMLSPRPSDPAVHDWFMVRNSPRDVVIEEIYSFLGDADGYGVTREVLEELKERWEIRKEELASKVAIEALSSLRV